MSAVIVVLIALAAADLAGLGLLLGLAWVEHRRQRRLARAAGEPVPPSATGQFAFLAALGLVGILALYSAIVFLADR